MRRADGEPDPHTAGSEERDGGRTSGGGSGATDLGSANGDRNTGVLTRVEELEENSDRGGLVEIENDVLHLTVFQGFCQISTKGIGFDVEIEGLIAEIQGELVCLVKFGVFGSLCLLYTSPSPRD